MKKIYKIIFSVSLVLVVLSFVAIFVFGLPLGVDFKGGSTMEIELSEGPRNPDEIVRVIASVEGVSEVRVVLTGSAGFIARFNDVGEKEHRMIISSLESEFGTVNEKRFDSIGPIIGSELKSKSITAIILVLIAITIYIATVFRRLSNVLSPWVMGLSAIVALVHDIIIPVGVFVVLGHYIGIEISAIFIAAVLTILGYSVSDTVVVFDRVRENILRYGSRDSFPETVHRSVMQTLSRSINTTISTILALVAIYFFGGESLKFFSLALIIGIVAGSYSSIFVASPLLVWMSRKHKSF